MKNIISELFTKKWFIEKQNIYCSHTNDYFFIEEYNHEEIYNFFESEKTKKSIGNLLKLSNNTSDFPEIAKNTTYIILCKYEDFQKDFENLQKIIMDIEEDEYFFKKNIILYDQKAKDDLEAKIQEKENKWKLENILNELFSNLHFWELRKTINTDSYHFLLCQLFIKIPFLEINITNNEIYNLQEKIESTLKSKNMLDFTNNCIVKFKNDYDNLEENIDKYMEDFTDIDNFIDQFNI